MPAPLSTALLVFAALLCFTVTPWAGIPIAVLAVGNEVARFLISAPEADSPPSFDD